MHVCGKTSMRILKEVVAQLIKNIHYFHYHIPVRSFEKIEKKIKLKGIHFN